MLVIGARWMSVAAYGARWRYAYPGVLALALVAYAGALCYDLSSGSRVGGLYEMFEATGTSIGVAVLFSLLVLLVARGRSRNDEEK